MSISGFLLAAWDPKPSVIAGCLGLLAAYAWLVRFRFSARAAAWGAGVALLLLASISPLDELAGRYLFSAHMAKHILFVLVIPALLLLGVPSVAAGRGLRSQSLARVERWLASPAVAWPAGIGAMILWHIPALFNAALVHPPLHIAEHLSLLAGGTIYWWPILSPLRRSRLSPVPQAAAYLTASCLACTAMGVLITFAPKLLYPAYAHPADPYGILQIIRQDWGISAALDQQIGGLLMWVPCCLVYLTAIMAMFGRWYAEESQTPVEV